MHDVAEQPYEYQYFGKDYKNYFPRNIEPPQQPVRLYERAVDAALLYLGFVHPIAVNAAFAHGKPDAYSGHIYDTVARRVGKSKNVVMPVDRAYLGRKVYEHGE